MGTLAEAREQALENRKFARAGGDPLAGRNRIHARSSGIHQVYPTETTGFFTRHYLDDDETPELLLNSQK
ncbi:MAG: hypothetical protein ACLFQT_05845 [Thiohalophilus sp.]